jgi:hypothetical protein
MARHGGKMKGFYRGLWKEDDMRLKFGFLTVLAVLGEARGAYAQGCALCYTTASAAGAAAQRSLDWGILALLAPALTMFLCVMFLLYRRAVSASA